ncbi:MAG: hypothetical protein LBI60_02520, partial [Bacteroidales bacterium]|nr:hypothetical protein [Bacteroidales bacterium]
GLIAVLDDGIELSIGMHTANNIFGCLFLSYENSALKTSALFKQETIHMQTETIVLLAAGLLAIFFFSKRYKWNFSIMNQRIRPIQPVDAQMRDDNQTDSNISLDK